MVSSLLMAHRRANKLAQHPTPAHEDEPAHELMVTSAHREDIKQALQESLVKAANLNVNEMNNLEVPIYNKDTPSCKHCNAKKDGRNLILCFDGTSNQFGENVAHLPVNFWVHSLNLCRYRIRTLSSSMTVLSRIKTNLHTTIAASARTQNRFHPLNTGDRF
jgi:hypothetical protein